MSRSTKNLKKSWFSQLLDINDYLLTKPEISAIAHLRGLNRIDRKEVEYIPDDTELYFNVLIPIGFDVINNAKVDIMTRLVMELKGLLFHLESKAPPHFDKPKVPAK